MNEKRYLFGLSFTVGSNTGIALVVASSERQAFQLLKNSGRYNCSPDKYTLIQSRNLGLSSCLPYELLFEEYTNADIVYKAFERLASQIKGNDGKDGSAGKDGKDGKDGANGLTPFIGDNGNWWIGSVDTGVPATFNETEKLTRHEIDELLNFELKDEPLTHPEIDELLNF